MVFPPWLAGYDELMTVSKIYFYLTIDGIKERDNENHRLKHTDTEKP